MSSEQQTNYINILLLGETGVGKSTFINIFANYLSYDTLEQAVNGDPVCLIPTQFLISDADYNQTLITYGQVDENESCNVEGESVTRGCVTYCFTHDCHTIRLIDTPGVGDTRGLDQDKDNLDCILRFIAQYDVLHLICILMRPNQERLTPGFEYCFRELLRHLQKDASKNMVFLFSNTRATGYKPGTTRALLSRMLATIESQSPDVCLTLDKHTMYCVDNEPFKYLCAVKQGINFEEQDVIVNTTSWDNSVKECLRLFNYLYNGRTGNQGLTPHPIQNTLSINETRRLIVALVKPLFQIINIIKHNLCVLELTQVEIKNYQGDIDKLNHENIRMGYWKQLVLKPVSRLFRSKFNSVKEIMDRVFRIKCDQKDRKLLVREYDIKIEQNKNEHAKILKSITIFEAFLNHNAITSYSDTFEEYVRQQIDKLRLSDYDDTGANDDDDKRTAIATMYDILKQYNEQKQLLGYHIKMSTNDCADRFTLESVDREIRGLYYLQETGNEIKHLHRQSMTKHDHKSSRSTVVREVNGKNIYMRY
ncbi:uncharacterized protein LOC128951256 [Oppia nitens]|uniref:uncharacterized protein LOC128951256 n=1 Tax=Oppia nitens TaxID=1686743 RepID=UPI0023DBB410|nr:uncharacterized protein LOC128951256 [Oppia nitens]